MRSALQDAVSSLLPTLPAQATAGQTEQSAWLVFAILGGFTLVFPLFWCAVVWLLSRIGGWHRLAERYDASDRSPTGHRHSGVTGMVGGTSYRNVLTVYLGTDGFFLDVMVLFKVGHPRLFIPWADVGERRSRKALWRSAERLSIGRPAIGTVTLPSELLASDSV